MKSYVVVSDLQVPYHHRKAVDNLLEFIREYQPDGLLNVGDDVDAPEPSRWNKGLAGEYAPTLQAGLDATADLHLSFRQALGPGLPYHVSRSNHGDRTETYVRKYAPALASLRCLDISALLGYEEADITFHRKPFEFAPGWLLMHGDEGGSSTAPGGTAASLARLTGKSVICGHTHKLGAQHYTTGVNGKQVHRWGLEVGHLMDVKKASYLAAGTANWHAGFGVIHVEGTSVSWDLVPVAPNGSFIYDGIQFGGKR